MHEDPWGCMGRPLLPIFLLSLLLLPLACYDTPYALIPEDDASIDPKLVGDWTVREEGTTDETTRLVVRQFDTHRYFMEWGDAQDPLRMAGFLVQVGGGWWLQARSIAPDAGNTYMLVRIGWQDQTPYFRHLDEDFMKKLQIESADDLRAVLEQNLDNDALYKGGKMVLTAAAKPAEDRPDEER